VVYLKGQYILKKSKQIRLIFLTDSVSPLLKKPPVAEKNLQQAQFGVTHVLTEAHMIA
jgi:hypothetical protein